VLVHCAGSASIHESIRNPGNDYESHVALTHWLADRVEHLAPDCRIVYVSSAAVYGQPAVLPVSETAPVRPLSPYGYHKRLAEMILEQASALRGLKTVCARVFSAYGPGLGRQVIWEAASQALRQGEIELAGTGRETRDFLHAEDVARALFLLAVKAPAQGEIFNVAQGIEISIRDMAEQIARTCGLPSPHFLGIPRNGDPARWCADTGRLRELGFVPRIPFEAGLKTVLDWVRTEESCKT
jgi:UDP-glucose 4-epimerase